MAFGFSQLSYKSTGRVLSTVSLLVITILLAWYSVLSLPETIDLAGDRSLYWFLYQSNVDISSRSKGLAWEWNLLRQIAVSKEFLFFSTSFLFILLTLISLKNCKQSTPQALLLLSVSIYFIYGYVLLKQNMANAFSCAAFTSFFNITNENNRKKIILILLTVLFVSLSFIFHESAYLLVLVFPVLFLWDNKYVRWVGTFAIFAALIAIPFFNSSILTYFMNANEDLESQVAAYASAEMSTNIITIVKGAPFYIITIVGFINRRNLIERISNYDRYLLLSLITSAASILSMVNYWYFRFGMLLYAPVFVYAGLIHHEQKKSNENHFWFFFICLIFIALAIKQLAQYYMKHGGI